MDALGLLAVSLDSFGGYSDGSAYSCGDVGLIFVVGIPAVLLGKFLMDRATGQRK